MITWSAPIAFGASTLQAGKAGLKSAGALAIGPDGGWVPYEIDLFSKHGFTPVSLGKRVLRGEVAVPSILGAVRAALPAHE